MSEVLTDHDRETIITFNKEDKTAYIFTYEKTWQRHLEKRLGLKPTMNNGFGGKEYQIDKKHIPMPRAPRKPANSTKKRLTERLQRNRVLRAQNRFPVGKSGIVRKEEGNSTPLIEKEVVNALLRR